MAIVVQKYGGSSVADVARILQVADRVAETRAGGKQVVVVVSAMGDTTDDLMALAGQICESPSRRELDMLLTAGERISMTLLSMALNARGVPAVSFTGSQSGIITTDSHTNARILEVRPFRVKEEIDRGKVVIVAGYQGVSLRKEVTTLGRGGSDTTAVALAAALGAEGCEIYSDVDGVYSADPKLVPQSRRLDTISYEEMQEMAQAGAKVLNAQAVEFAKEQGIVIHARQAFGGGGETLVVPGDAGGERGGRIAGIAGEGGLFLLSFAAPNGSEDPDLLGFLDERKIHGKQLLVDEQGQASLVIAKEATVGWRSLLQEWETRFGCRTIVEEDLAAISVIGAGINEDFRNVRRFLQVLSRHDVKPRQLTTSRFRISALLPETRLDESTLALHREFLGEGKR